MEKKENLGKKKIYIDNDLTHMERIVRDKVSDKAREYIEAGNEVAIIAQKKVRTEEGTWAWSERKQRWFVNKEKRFQTKKREKSSEQANYIMNLPRPSSSGKLGAWTRQGQQKVDDITSTHV